MRLLVPITENKGLNSEISEHFGHCSHFAIYEQGKELEIIKNQLDHSNPKSTPVDQIMRFQPTVVFAKEIGQKAIKLFKEKGVSLKTENYNTLREVIENINDLKEISQGCGK